MSAASEARLRRPRTRGAFMPLDAASRQLALLSVANPGGDARLYWLVELPALTVSDTRFLAFGALSGHAVMDAFSELARGRTVADACRLTAEQVESLLRDDPATPAFPDGLKPLAFLRELQDLAEAEVPQLALLPRPAGTVAYQRKRQADWSAEDRSWLPLSLLKKAAAVEAVCARVLRERLGHQAAAIVDGPHDDYQVTIRFTGLEAEQAPTAGALIQDDLRSSLHSQLTVTVDA
jgi:NifU-like protein involved in Fe-S cluster formation